VIARAQADRRVHNDQSSGKEAASKTLLRAGLIRQLNPRSQAKETAYFTDVHMRMSELIMLRVASPRPRNSIKGRIIGPGKLCAAALSY
jgi:hypothetical protein